MSGGEQQMLAVAAADVEAEAVDAG